MTTVMPEILTFEDFKVRFEEAGLRYANKYESPVFSLVDAAVAATMEARLPLFGTNLSVATFVQRYFFADTDELKQKIIAEAYKLHNPIGCA